MCEKKNDYNNRNCARCPIQGQLEVTTQMRGISKNTQWTIEGGLFFPVGEKYKDDL